MRKISSSFSIIDCLFLLFILAVIITSLINNSTIVSSYIVVLIPCYFGTRFLNSISKTPTDILIVLISIWCIFECGLGLYQEIQSIFFDPSISFRGTFSNPGPYGGFLSVSASLLFPYVRNSDNRIMKRIASFALIPALVLLPATFSRTAIFSCVICICWFELKNEGKAKQFIFNHKLSVSLIIVLLIFGAYKFKERSADSRFYMNKISIEMLRSNDICGVGLGKYGGRYGDTQYSYFKKKMSNTIDDQSIASVQSERMIADCPSLAYNDYLQMGVESGVITMLFYMFLVVYAVCYSIKQNTIWGYALLSFSIFSLFSYPLEIFQFQLLFSISLGMCTNKQCQEIIRRTSYVFLIPVLLSIIFIISSLGYLSNQRSSKKKWYSVAKWYDKEFYEFVVDDYPGLFDGLSNNSQFIFEYGRSLNKMGFYEKSDSILLCGAKISSDPMFWNVMGNNSLSRGQYREAEERYKHAFFMVPNRLYPLTLLAKLYDIEGDTARFLNMADLVERFEPKIENKTTKRLKAEISDIKEGYSLSSSILYQ